MSIILDKLDELERVVFLLKEVFVYSHKEIAEMLNIQIENSRQILSRSKKKIKAEQVYTGNPINAKNKQFIQDFLNGVEEGDISSFIQQLTIDGKMSIDGGQKRRAPLRTLTKPSRIYAFLKGILPFEFFKGKREIKVINGQYCLFISDGQHPKCLIFLSLNLEQTQIKHIYIINNPEKIKYFMP